MNTFTKLFCVGVITADLFAIVYFTGQYLTTGSVFPEAKAEQSVIATAEGSTASNLKTAAAKPAEEDLSNYVADASKGKKLSGKCKACHSFKNDGRNGVGPNLYGIFNAKIANVEGFKYSGAFNDQKGKIVWDDENLDGFMKKPKKFIPKNKMAFGGIKKAKDRKNLIAYLKTLK